MKRTAIILLCLFVLPAPAVAQKKRPMEIDDLFRFKRVADPQISPDGRWVVYALTTIVDPARNKSKSNVWLASTDGKVRRHLTTTEKRDSSPRWSPDGKRILFQSNRSGGTQLWVIDLGGGEARQLTSISTEASNGTWSPDGKQIAFVSAVWPEFSAKPFKESDALNKKKMDERAESPVKAKVFTRLFYRHWDDYVEDKRQHLFVIPFADDKAGEPRNVTPGDYDAFPTSSTFESSVSFTFSPDGTHLLFTAPPKTNEAWSTNYDIWRIATNGKGKPENLTAGNKAADTGPQFSPDGRKLAYRAQQKPGYEADRWELMVVGCDESGALKGKPQSVTAINAFSSNEFVWVPDQGNGERLVEIHDWKGKTVINDMPSSGTTNLWGFHVSSFGQNYGMCVSRNGTMMAFVRAQMHQPPEVIVSKTIPDGSGFTLVSHANTELLAELDMQRPESVTVEGAGDTPMQMWILKPPGFDPMKKWPVAYLVHGGPQGAWTDGWSYRWNPKLWAAQGYVVALPNPRGSTGFGQKYVDEISGDWGGKCYEDLMKGLDWLEQQPWVDKDRIGAAGASFGGYMMNWFAVNTNRFKCLITHCSVWNFESMYATTDELWFDEWEHGGPPWGKNRHSYEKHSPHRLAANLAKFKTPMLVIHNDLDFRCPIGQGHELFTTLQRLRVPSRMVNFPDEGHWVLKPANSRYWHQEVFAWLGKYVPPGGR
ncbi:MAG: S9 family peptidase [Gemmataceae bacterium]|nr:S9 family peptidase [Gemmataceae bacterium]